MEAYCLVRLVLFSVKRKLAALTIVFTLLGAAVVEAQTANDEAVAELEAAQDDLGQALANNQAIIDARSRQTVVSLANENRSLMESMGAHISTAIGLITTTTTTPTTTTTAPTTTTTAPTTTTTVPPTTTTTAPAGCVGLQVAAGANLMTIAAAQPAGTTFCLAAGQYNITGTGVAFQTGDQFIGALGTGGERLSVLDGGDTATRVGSCTCSNGVLRNVIIEDFNMAVQQGPTGPALTSWLFDNIESRFNSSDGIHVHDGSTVRGGYFHHNGEIGVGGQGDNTLVENAEIAFNNQNLVAGRGGGTKFVNTINLTVRNNHVHDNLGPGIWADGGNVGTLVEGNLVEDNDGEGIFHEINNGAALITANTVRCNAGAGEIYIANSRGSATDPIVVSDNIVGAHCNPNVGSIVAKDDPNRSPRLGYTRFENNQVTANNVVAGVFGTDPIVAPGMEFVSNDYVSSLCSGNAFRWGNPNITWTAWRNLGFDLTGTCVLP